MNHVSCTTCGTSGAESDPGFPEFSSSKEGLVNAGSESEWTFVTKDEIMGSIR
jgi:hypothetical protein